jgi:glycosyltransferase involved in cell wall biosynthesis
MMRPKVLFVSGEYPPLPGGIGDYTANLRLALATMGARSVVLTSRGATGEDVSTVRRWGWSSVASVVRLARREGVDIVHIQYQAGAFGMHPALNALPALISRRLPVVTTFHDLRVPYLFPKAGPLRKTAIVRMAKGSDAVIVTNPADARALANEDIAVTQIPIGPNLPPPGPVAAHDEQTVAFFGFPARSKGIIDLVEALSSLPQPRPRLKLIGAQGESGTTNDILSAGEIDGLIAHNGLDILRTGYLAPAAASAALAQATVIALPFVEGASLRSGSLLAALQSGRPVVTTSPRMASDLGDLANLPQLLLTSPGDLTQLASMISSGLAWNGQAAPLPAAYRWQTIAEAHAALYRRVLDERLQ